MNIEEKKISIIQWIANLEDEHVIDELQKFRKVSSKVLPDEIVTLLKKSDSFREDQCIEHTSTRDLINNKS